MKLSEFSWREHIALAVLPSFAGQMIDTNAAWRAFSVADAFLKQAGKYRDAVAEAEKRTAEAETALSVMREHVQGLGDYSARMALSQLWDMLGVSNQTNAVQALRVLQGREP